MGQKFLQITESAASSQTEEDRHPQDPGLAFSGRSGGFLEAILLTMECHSELILLGERVWYIIHHSLQLQKLEMTEKCVILSMIYIICWKTDPVLHVTSVETPF
jgi:hypothetical protein